MTSPASRIKPITFAAYPIDGGELPLAGPKFWSVFFSFKVNGWRGILHTPTETLFNRKGELLSIADAFEPAVKKLNNSPFEWLDVEALERRHKIGQGTLIILDIPVPVLTARERYEKLVEAYGDQMLTVDVKPDPDSVLLMPQKEMASEESLYWWNRLQEINKEYGADFYEGLVARRCDSLYPLQLDNPTRKCSSWTKHRWEF